MFDNINQWPLDHWHIEISSKCSLMCPRCSRQEVPEGLVNTDLGLDWFKGNFDRLITHAKKITFCGDDGDPIYAREFIPVLKWMRKSNPDIQFVIVTNGSYKTPKWWENLNRVLNERDNVHFSIDGWDHESNNQYRVNNDWDSIMKGADLLTNPIKTWAMIVFKYNEDHIDRIRTRAVEHNFDYFQITHSSKFVSNYANYPTLDPLEPNKNYVAKGRFVRELENISKYKWKDSCYETFASTYRNMSKSKIMPLCRVGNKGLYINSRGEFYPCCWTGLRYDHNKNLFHVSMIKANTLEESMNNQGWTKFYKEMNSGNCPKECSEKCNLEKWNLEHATQW